MRKHILLPIRIFLFVNGEDLVFELDAPFNEFLDESVVSLLLSLELDLNVFEVFLRFDVHRAAVFHVVVGALKSFFILSNAG